ncbi:MAG: SemiSWEET transporter [Candidatus Omnitrophica bacterium]|nr:SemiSWEET transporter [Candidatus Omnitrophota bacterium]
MKSFIIGLIAGSLCTISFLPQVIRIFKTKRTKDLSLITFSVFSLGVLLWLIYGILIGELPIILANTATLALALLIVIMKIKYK